MRVTVIYMSENAFRTIKATQQVYVSFSLVFKERHHQNILFPSTLGNIGGVYFQALLANKELTTSVPSLSLAVF